MYAPEIAGQIVNACAVLHNMRLHYRLSFNIEEDLQNEYAEPDERDNSAAEIQDVVPCRAPRAVAQQKNKLYGNGFLIIIVRGVMMEMNRIMNKNKNI